MCKKTILSVCLFLLGNMAFAQGVLQVSDISQPNDVYSSAEDEAAVIIRCHESIPLKFSSTMDKSADPFQTELQGADSVYYIAFPTGNRYRGRELTIIARGFSPVVLNLDLQPKQLLSFQIIDPNATVDAGCYRGHRNKGMEEIKNSNYEEARNQFIVARECSDCDAEENEKNIATADSLILFRAQAEEAFKLLDYVQAGKIYSKVIALNPYDTYATNRNTICVQNFAQECGAIFSKAEFYYTERDYDRAKALYEQVIAKECTSNLAIATERLNAINTQQRARRDHSHVISYEWRKDVPIGIHTGSYNMHKVGGFFQLDLNPEVFNAIRKDCQYGDKKFPEMNIAFGWTIKIANPVWIHFGPGFTGKMYYGEYAKDKYPTDGYGDEGLQLLDLDKMGVDKTATTMPKDIPTGTTKDDDIEDAWKHTNFAFAVSPVVGLTVKYSYFAFRLTYQYRWSIQSKLKDFMGPSRLSIGVGVAF